MAKYRIVPGGRTDNALQGAKRIAKKTAIGGATGLGAAVGMTPNSFDPVSQGAAGFVVGTAAGLGKGIIDEVRQHHALRKDQFKRY